MGIDFRWEDENGEQLEEILDPKNFLGLALSLSDLKETTCLRFVDPYGHTVFNQWQIPVFINELQALRSIITAERLATFFKERNDAYYT
jgi:hypothetical protein